MSAGWTIVLNGVAFAGGDLPSGITPEMTVGCLTEPPNGMGVPALRVEDTSFLQKDGVKHFSDWYEPRILTNQNVMVCNDGCPSCPTVRTKIQTIARAWSRYCDDTELVVFTDCHDASSAVTGEARAAIGPYGIIGRPRVASHVWETTKKSKCARYLLRFDAVDHRLYVLDADGTPGSGAVCATLTPAINTFCRTYDRCYPMCYDTDISTPGSGPQQVENFGSECAFMTITLTGHLTTPTITITPSGDSLTYEGVIAVGETVVIDTETGTATDGNGDDVTFNLTGDVNMVVDVGNNEIQMNSLGAGDTGAAIVCFRPFVVSG